LKISSDVTELRELPEITKKIYIYI